MLFTEFRFFPFFLLVFAVHWSLRSNTLRKAWLLVASYVFYGTWDPRFLALIVLSTVVDYTAALRMESPGARRLAWLRLSVIFNLSTLGFFKYWGFSVESAGALLEWLGFQAHLPTLRVVLPVGISFYTFQTMSYTLDVYHRRMRPTRSLLDVATFVAFFPQLVAGPIVRAIGFLPQLAERRDLRRVDVRAALVLFFVGFFKKTCVSDNLAPVVDRYFADPASFDAASAWSSVLAYAVQLYGDFSGYSDMAIACAALLGYRLPLNFAFPYFATNVNEVWQRWHVTLSSFFRDYLYFGLGGNRGSKLFVARNLMLTMLLSGLWHGAAWTYVAWGALQGLGLIVYRSWRNRPEDGLGRRLVRPFAMPLTFWFWCVCLVPFRSQDFADTWVGLKAFVLLQAEGTAVNGLRFLWFLPVLAAVHWVSSRGLFTGWWRRVSLPVFAGAYAVLWAVSLPFVPIGFTPFIYFQF